MSTIVLKRLEKMKGTMDTGTLVYIFPTRAIGVDRTFGSTPWNQTGGDMKTFLTDRFPKWMNDEHPLYVIYKNSNGIWVDTLALHNAYPTADVFAIANSHGHLFPFDPLKIPPVTYTDGQGCLYYIDQCDGVPGTPLAEITVDEQNSTEVAITQFSLQNPTMGIFSPASDAGFENQYS